MATMPARGGTAAAWLTIATVGVALFEGFAPVPYIDRIGRGQPVTWCFGETGADGPVPPMGHVFSKADCEKMLAKQLVDKYDKEVHGCIHVKLPPHREAALVSFTYNLGAGALCHGAVARGINEGDVAAGCSAMRGYNHSNGKVVKGLTRRRQWEYDLCMRDD